MADKQLVRKFNPDQKKQFSRLKKLLTWHFKEELGRVKNGRDVDKLMEVLAHNAAFLVVTDNRENAPRDAGRTVGKANIDKVKKR